MRFHAFRLQILFALLCLPWSASIASEVDTLNPQPVIEEILVTAEFRDVTVADLAASATVIEPNREGTTVQHLEEILNRAPNVNYASGASRGRFIQVRGIGERGQFSEPLNASVGLIVDGVDLSGIGTAATLFDVAQVEILRGPQGTLYGANALAGLINVVTPPPSAEHTASIRLDVGDYNALGIGGVVSGPMGEQGGYRISVQRYQDDGFIENDFLGKDDTNNHDEATYRAKLRWRSGAADWQLSLGHIDIDNGYDAFSLDNNRTTLSDQPGKDQQQTSYGALSLTLDVGDGGVVEAALSHATSEVDYGYDEDWTFTGFDPNGYTSTDRYLRDRDTTTLEARWLTKPSSSTWDWVLGVYALNQEVDLQRRYTFLPGPFNSNYEVDRIAVYAEVARNLSDAWRMTLGARFERHQADYADDLGVNFEPRDDLFGSRVLFEYDLDERSLLYAGVTQGYKSGGFNTDGSLVADLREFDPETLWNIEAGYKSRLLDGRLAVRASVFRMQRQDIQIATSTERPIPNSNAVQFIVYTGNAAEGFNQGLELESEFALNERVTLFANIGLLDSEYEDYTDNSGRDLDGREQAHAPTYQFFAGSNFALTEQLVLRLEVEGKDEYFYSDSHAAKSDRYELFNASLTYRADSWRVSLWGRNLADKDYYVRGFFFGNDPRDFYTARPFTQLGEPRQIGLTVQANW